MENHILVSGAYAIPTDVSFYIYERNNKKKMLGTRYMTHLTNYDAIPNRFKAKQISFTLR